MFSFLFSLRGNKRGPKRGTRRGARKVEASKGQRTLLEFMKKPKEPTPEIPTPIPVEEESSQDPEHNMLQETRDKLINFVKMHQLHEVLSYFQNIDQFLLRFSIPNIKELYDDVQRTMVEEFGAPLSPSLFPQHLWDKSVEPNSFPRSSESQSLA